MRKIYLTITPFFPEPGVFRGPYVLDQVKAIERNSQYQVVVLKPRCFWSKEKDYEIDGVKVFRFNSFAIPSNLWPNKFCAWLTARSMLKKLKEINVSLSDIAIAHAHVAELGSNVNYLKEHDSNILTIIQHHGFDVMSVSNGRLANCAFHKRHCIKYGVDICNKADINVGVSGKTLDYVRRQPLISIKNEYILYNGVDTTIFNKKTSRNDSAKNHIFTIGCVGNFWKLKDQMTLIKAAELLVNNGTTDFKVIFVGSGYTKEECIEYIEKNKIGAYFEFRKEVMHDMLPSFYSSLDLFVLPSYWEAFGCVYTEAFACGVPFVGVKGQGISELIPKDDIDKWLIKKGDYRSLSKIIHNVKNGVAGKQELTVPYDIDELIGSFIDYSNKILWKK